MKKALENGVTHGEIVAAITHLAFYASWRPAMTALNIARPCSPKQGLSHGDPDGRKMEAWEVAASLIPDPPRTLTRL